MFLLQLSIILMLVYYIYIDPAFGNIPGLAIAVGLMMIMILLYYNFDRRLKGGLWKELSYEGKAYIIFFAVIFIPGIIISPNLSSYLYSYLKGILYVILFISVYFVVRNKKSMDLMFQVLGISIFAYALHTFFFGTIEPGTGRLIISSLGNPNDMAVCMYTGIVLVTYFWNKGLIYKLVSFGYIPMALSNIAMSGSRKGFIGAGIYLVSFILCSYVPNLSKRGLFKAITSLIIIIILASLIYFWYAPMFSESILFNRLSRDKNSDESTIVRIEMYRIAFQLFKEYPFFGVGYDNYKYFSGLNMFSHSTYAEVLSCTGIIGTVIYFSIYISILYKLAKLYIYKIKNKLSIILEGIMLCFMLVDLVFCFVRIDLYDPVVYVILACIAGYYEINKRLLGEFTR